MIPDPYLVFDILGFRFKFYRHPELIKRPYIAQLIEEHHYRDEYNQHYPYNECSFWYHRATQLYKLALQVAESRVKSGR